MSPLYVRPYGKVHKNDYRDAEAISKAATRPAIQFGGIRSEEPLDLQALHRARERLVTESNALSIKTCASLWSVAFGSE